MITVRKAIELLSQCPLDANLYAYDDSILGFSRDSGIVIQMPDSSKRFIRAMDNDKLDDYIEGFM